MIMIIIDTESTVSNGVSSAGWADGWAAIGGGGY